MARTQSAASPRSPGRQAPLLPLPPPTLPLPLQPHLGCLAAALPAFTSLYQPGRGAQFFAVLQRA